MPFQAQIAPFPQRVAPNLRLVRGAVGETAKNFLGRVPSATIGPFRGARDTLRLMATMALGARGERSPMVRSFTEWIVGQLWPKDYLGEILAIRNCLVQRSPWNPELPLFRYVNDPRHMENVKDPQRCVEEIQRFGTCHIDCDEFACLAATMALVIGREPEFVALGFAPDSLTHVATRVREPKSNEWIWLDAVAGPKERDAAERAQQILTWSLD